MRVLHYDISFSDLSKTFIYDYITELERQNVENFVITENRLNQTERPFEKVLVVKEPGIFHPERLLRRVQTAAQKKEPRLANWAILRRRLASAVQEIKPDLIHAHFGPQGVKIWPVADKLNIPLIISFYGYDVSRLIRDNFWLEKYQEVFKTSNVVIGISNYMCSKLEMIGAKKNQIRLLHLGIKIENFDFAKQNRKRDNTIECLHVGRLVEKKSPLDLVKAFNHAVSLGENDTQLKLKIVGEGPLKGPLVTKIKKLELQHNVKVLGALPHSEIPKLMKSADIYTQHCKTAEDGDQEGQGVTFVEASAIGLPIISTNHNGLPDVIKDNQTGILVEEGDYKAMGREILRLANNQELRLTFGKNGRKHIENNFDLRKQVTKAKIIYAEVLDQ